MARYIDAETLKRNIRVNLMPNVDVDGTITVENAERYFLNLIEKTSTADVVEVVRCFECIHAVELDKHCELNRFAYRHCNLCRGEEENNVWHKYKKYYKDYSLVEPDDFCSYGKRKESE